MSCEEKWARVVSEVADELKSLATLWNPGLGNPFTALTSSL
jgi:hypothetical protein